MKDDTRCFVIVNGGYEEITYAAHKTRRESDPAYAGRRFIRLRGMLMEVTKAVRRDFYKDKRRQKYPAEEAARHGNFSYNELDGEGMSGEDIIADDAPTPEAQAVENLLLEEMRRCFARLADADRDLLTAYYFYGKVDDSLAKQLGVAQKTINLRRHKAIGKLKKILNF